MSQHDMFPVRTFAADTRSVEPAVSIWLTKRLREMRLLEMRI